MSSVSLSWAGEPGSPERFGIVELFSDITPQGLLLSMWAAIAGLNLLLSAAGGYRPDEMMQIAVTCLGGLLLSILLETVAFKGAIARSRPRPARAMILAALSGTVLWLLDAAGQAWFVHHYRTPARLISTLVDLRFNLLYFDLLFVLQACSRIAAGSARVIRTQDGQLTRARLEKLQLQLNPHFLLNTLNTIEALVAETGAAKAEEMLARLSEHLQRALTADPHLLASLCEELEAVDTYLGIEAIRFGERLVVTYDCEPGLADAEVPSFVLQPLVENTVKHAVSKSNRPISLSIVASTDGGLLKLRVIDDGPAISAGDRGATSGGVGLRNISSRLQVLYGSAASLRAAEIERGFEAVVTLPLRFGGAQRGDMAASLLQTSGDASE